MINPVSTAESIAASTLHTMDTALDGVSLEDGPVGEASTLAAEDGIGDVPLPFHHPAFMASSLSILPLVSTLAPLEDSIGDVPSLNPVLMAEGISAIPDLTPLFALDPALKTEGISPAIPD